MNDEPEPGPLSDALEIETFVDDRHGSQRDVAIPSYSLAEPVTHSPPDQQTPLRWREIIGVLCLIVLCDFTIYRSNGFAGLALLFCVAPILLWLSSSQRCRGSAFWILSVMLIALAGKMVWCGSATLVAVGFALIVTFAMALVGLRPYVIEAFFFALQTLHAGYLGIIKYGRRINQLGPVMPRAGWISVVLPLVAFLVFGWIFILANPDLTVWFGEGMQRAFDVLQDWVHRFSPDLLEAGFCAIVLWVVVGLLRPGASPSQFSSSPNSAGTDDTTVKTDAYLYPAFRNTLVTVIVLFAVYLVFEFQTLWFHTIEPGFHYSGYAHEGAAWLTVALAMATVTLSLVFRGSILREHRLRSLRRLAWLWSIENMLLAAAVYNRLFIYIGFNGMSRMRIVALYGMSAVVVGFLLVVWKIARNRGFLWLVRRHLWTLAVSLYLLALTPMDTIVVGYNVRRILDGDPAPSVQISVQPINSEGILMLQPLLECDDEIIREGVRALLAEHHHNAESTAARRIALGWTTYQIADRVALEDLRKNSDRWKRYTDPASRQPALDRFHKYAYQWY